MSQLIDKLTNEAIKEQYCDYCGEKKINKK